MKRCLKCGRLAGEWVHSENHPSTRGKDTHRYVPVGKHRRIEAGDTVQNTAGHPFLVLWVDGVRAGLMDMWGFDHATEDVSRFRRVIV